MQPCLIFRAKKRKKEEKKFQGTPKPVLNNAHCYAVNPEKSNMQKYEMKRLESA